MKHIFWHVILPIAIIAGANAYDWKSTSDAIHAGNIESNSAWIIGKHPSNLKITVGGGSIFALETFTYLRGEKHDKLKWLTRSTVAYQVSDHIRLGIRNEFNADEMSKRYTNQPGKFVTP